VSRSTSGSIVALVTHARHVPSDQRARFAEALHREPAGRALILETCHRVEAYTTSADDAARLARALPAGGLELTGDLAVRHAMSVAVGCDSVVVGEDQILHQLRASVDAARAGSTLEPVLERLFAHALHAGRRARSWRQGPPRSLADVAIASIERLSGPIRGREVLVVGAGRMGRLSARAAGDAGASVAVANRSASAAEALAALVGARTEAYDPDDRIGRFAGVIVALAGPWPIGAATIEVLARSTTVVVDLSVPPAVPARLADLLGVRLITADAIAVADPEPGALQDGPAGRFETLIEDATGEFIAWQRRRDGRTTAQALVERADREREAQLAALWRRVRDLEPEARDAVEVMARHLGARLLREPLERLGRDPDGRDARAIRDIFGL